MSEERLKGIKHSLDFQEIMLMNEKETCDVDLEGVEELLKEEKDLYNEVIRLQQENKQLKEEIETILDFDYFKNECPLNIGFGGELENKAQDVFYEDEYCESCKDDYKACWLKYFKKLQELKEKYK